jgi:tRNA threonylcarbamoyladenosine biosynthesis protein TsaB
MNVLAIDTASACSVALAGDGRILAHRYREIARGHAEALLPMIAATLGDAGLDYRDIDLIAASIGPGSFTGLRTGLAAARGLALALGKPVLGVSSLEAVARLADAGRPLLVALETKREDVYVQLFSAAGEPLSKPMVCRPDAVVALVPAGKIAVAGDATHRLPSAMVATFLDGIRIGDAAVVATIACERSEQAAGPELLRPLYLAPPQAKPQPDGGAVRP